MHISLYCYTEALLDYKLANYRKMEKWKRENRNGNVCMHVYRESMLKMVLIQTDLPINVYIYILETFLLRVWDFQH